MRRTFTILLLVAVLFLPAFADDKADSAEPQQSAKIKADSAKVPDVEEIVNKANLVAYYQGEDGKAKIKMTITDKAGRKRNREFIILRKDVKDGGDQKYYVYFQRPADVRKMVFMVHKRTARDKDDDRWLYLPSLDLVKRIAASDKRTSFVGSDFLYEDVSGRGLDEDRHELVETAEKYFVIKNVPEESEAVEFSYYNVYIDRETYVPVKMEYFDSRGKLYRTIEAKKVETIGEFPTVVEAVVKDLNKQSTTLMQFSDVKYNIKLGDIFTERYLRRPPREARR